MSKIKVKAPAKINFTLKVQKKREDGFHPIESIMAAINLFDYIEIETDENAGMVKIDSNSFEIPHDKSNIAYKAAELFLKETGIKTGVNIFIKKNIPVAAGLAGGSTDAAAVVWGLNRIYGHLLDYDKINLLLSKLGSDLNFCYFGGMKMCKGRGEILENVEFTESPITLIKPKGLKISAGEAYKRFDEILEEGMVSNLSNDLEFALLNYYKEIKYLHDKGFQMSGSGPSFFIKKEKLEPELRGKLRSEYLIIENLKTIDIGQSLA